ncbi:MAG: D-alanine--D-alanine ligase family protein [Litorilinea sp.]
MTAETTRVENTQTDNSQSDAARNLRIGVILGGRSSEHEVSLASAQNVIQALREAGYTVVPIGISPTGRWLTGSDPLAQLTNESAARAAQETPGIEAHAGGWDLLPRYQEDAQTLAAIDVIFPVLHGPFGEDGTIQGLLEMANLPYVGCGVLTSAVAMDKAIAKRLLAAEGILQAPSHLIQRSQWRNGATIDNAADNLPHNASHNTDDICAQVEARFGYPVFVKPANLGSSIGVSKARNRPELIAAIDLAADYDRKILVEAAIPHAREIEVSVLGNHAPIASIPGEVIPGHEFYDYEAKYLDDSSRLVIPAELEADQVRQVQEMALAAFRALDAEGLARVDFLMNSATGEFYLNEINTMPGFTRNSMYPKLWEASGIAYPELVHRLVQLAVERYDERSHNRTSR